MYRSLSILDDGKYYRMFMSKPSFVICHLILAFVAIGITVPFHFGLEADSNVSKFVSKYPSAAKILNEESVILYMSSDNSWMKRMMLVMVFGMAFAEVCSLAMAFGIILHLKRSSAFFSAKTYRMHLQLTFLLIAQLTTPIVFVLLPTILTLILVANKFAVPQLPVRVLIIFLTLYAPSNSLLTVLFVTPFRKFTYGLMERT
ncbi:serpentine type 7TM GPCR chemoreceptor srh domain-containing protein [Ditylenchus destructor]|uniref:Serpentine type 7TM GPCR chemoreceptor srh domain-containing protein n=1 Tax=Ditylenchus destructor TaxID=166010 RepID=A0AAD4R2J0_9BILA|nr:serpentine type 7TM GPCR chemoreceptor srh domain-containing protein [Ditylenchus destructor]